MKKIIPAIAITIFMVISGQAFAVSLDTLDKKINTIKNNVINTSKNVNKMNPAGVGDMVDIVQDSMSKLSPETLEMLEDAGTEISEQIIQRTELITIFLDPDKKCSLVSVCAEFKDQILDLLVTLNTAATDAQRIVYPEIEPVSVVNENLIGLLEKIPGAALLPLWVATQRGLLVDDIQGRLQVSGYDRPGLPAYYPARSTMKDSGWGFVGVAHTTASAPMSHRQIGYSEGRFVRTSDTPTQMFMKTDCVRYPVLSSDYNSQVAQEIAIVYKVFAVVAKILISIIETVPDDIKPGVGIWGWVKTDLPAPPFLKPLKGVLDWIVNLTEGASSRLGDKVEACANSYKQMLIMQATPGVGGHETVWDGFVEVYDNLDGV